MDIALKQRLVGAVVLIALAVVVLPMLLGGRPDDGETEAQKIELPPQPEELNFQTRRYPLGEARKVPQEPGDESATGAIPLPQPLPEPDAQTDPRAVTHVEIESRQVGDALEAGGSPEPPAEATDPEGGDAAAPMTAPQAPPGGRYVVQVASFGSIANANRLAESLQGQGYGVLSDTVSSDVGTLHRVRVGPYPTEAEANAAVARLRQQVSDVKPRVVDLKPDLTAQVTTPSDPLVRWVVQLGSFSSVANADNLVERVRAEGLSAYREAVSTAGSTIYRVRAGPFVEREEAIRVGGQIRERLSVDGVVMSAD